MLERKYMIMCFFALCLTTALLMGITISGPHNSTPANVVLEYDSGWIDITDKCGQHFTITHNLDSTDIIVDITGKTTLGGGIHQRHLGLTGYTPEWSIRFGEDYGPMSSACALVQTADGGYAIGGNGFANLVKTDAAGDIQWNKTYEGIVYSIVQTMDFAAFQEGYAIAGTRENDFLLAETDANGNMLWNKTYGGLDDDVARSVIQTSDEGYAIAGIGFANLVKTDLNGNMLWNKTYGGNAYSVVETSDGGYALTGETGYDAWLVKVNSSGEMQWEKTYGGEYCDAAYSIVESNDGGYTLAGKLADETEPLRTFAWLLKTDSKGNHQWNQTFNLYPQRLTSAHSVVQTADGGYAMAGDSGSQYYQNAWVVKTTSNGTIQWTQVYGSTEMGSFYGASSMIQTRDEGYAVAGIAQECFWLARTSVEHGLALVDSTLNSIILYRGATDIYWNYVRARILVSEAIEVAMDTGLVFTLSPNPANPGQTVTLSGTLTDVYDNPVYPAEVKVSCSPDGGTTWIHFWTLNTNPGGECFLTFTAPATGEFPIKVSYVGSESYKPSSHTETLTVQTG